MDGWTANFVFRLNPTTQEIHPATYEDKFEELNSEATVPSPDSTVLSSGDVGHSYESSEVQASNPPVVNKETDGVNGTARLSSGTDGGEQTVIDGEGDKECNWTETAAGEGTELPQQEPAGTARETQSTEVLEEEEEEEDLPEVDIYSDLTFENRSKDQSPCTSSLIRELKAKPPEGPRTQDVVGSKSPPPLVQVITPVDGTPNIEAITTADSVDNVVPCQEEDVDTAPPNSNQIEELKQPLEEEIVELTEDREDRTDPMEGEVPGVPGVGRVEEVEATLTECDVPETCFFCDICYQIFVSSPAMNKHRETEHKDEEIEEESSGDESPVGVVSSYADKAISGAVKDVSYDETPESISGT